jgi:hypothetical protein
MRLGNRNQRSTNLEPAPAVRAEPNALGLILTLAVRAEEDGDDIPIGRWRNPGARGRNVRFRWSRCCRRRRRSGGGPSLGLLLSRTLRSRGRPFCALFRRPALRGVAEGPEEGGGGDATTGGADGGGGGGGDVATDGGGGAARVATPSPVVGKAAVAPSSSWRKSSPLARPCAAGAMGPTLSSARARAAVHAAGPSSARTQPHGAEPASHAARLRRRVRRNCRHFRRRLGRRRQALCP